MNQPGSRAELFGVMGLGPVWELKESPANTLLVNVASINAAPVEHNEAPGLNELRQIVSACRACGLCEGRTQTVFADGVENAPLMLVGEAPGADEDIQGLPFVGRAGGLLDKMLHAVDSSRQKNTYIANVLKCKPPANRKPEVKEIQQCSPYLLQQIAAVQPKVLLLVGQFAIQTLLNTDKPVGELRGKLHHVTVGGLNIPAVVTYHPAYLLRRPGEKAKAWDDLLLLKQLMAA